MTQYLSKKAKMITPYVAGEQPSDKGVIKLNTNENPFAPSPKVMKAAKAAINADMRKYPSAVGGNFRTQAAEYVGVSENNVFCGNGSDEVLGFAFQAFFEPGTPVLTPDISYSFYPVWAKLYDIKLKFVPLKDDFTLMPSDYFGSKGGVVLANPNAPTGIAISKADVEQIVANNKGQVVIIDEAYVEFGAESAVSLIKSYDNLLIVRTLSKSQSLAGMRAGFAVGSEKLISGLNRIKDSFNSYPINRVTETVAAAALADETYYKKINQTVIETREWTTKALEKLAFSVLPSKTNFVFAKPNKLLTEDWLELSNAQSNDKMLTSDPTSQNISNLNRINITSAEDMFKQLKANNIYVRWFNKPRIKDYLRITIGSKAEMQALIKAIKALS